MRVNALMTVRHADFTAPVVEYRFHEASLTSRWDELGMFEARDRLMEFDGVRRDRYLGPMLWRIDGSPPFCSALSDRVRRAGHSVASHTAATPGLSAAFAPEVYVHELSDTRPATPPNAVVKDATTVLVATREIPSGETDPAWHCCIGLGAMTPRPLKRPHAGWLVARDMDTLVQAIDIRAKTAQVNALRQLSLVNSRSPLVASVVVCTNRELGRLLPTLEAIAGQDFHGGNFETIVVDNGARGESAFRELTNLWPDRLKVVPCAIPGLSAARNVGLGLARGQYVCYLDDDAVPTPSWLSRICAAFDAHSNAGVIGGPALLRPPSPAPSVLSPGWETYWGHFAVDADGYREAHSWRDYPWGVNWAARRHALLEVGGFPLGFGRRPDDFGGGEEHIAAARIARRGYRVGIAGDAVVHHHVGAERFTEEHVRETMTARYLTAWRAAQELGETGHLAIVSSALRVALHHIDPRVKPLHLFWKDVAFRKSAQMRLLKAQWRDLRDSFRRPLDEAAARK
jgi:glycosyltransferase involved in cell wall biosynthesis